MKEPATPRTLLRPSELLRVAPTVIPWLVEGVLPAHALAALWGQPGCGKTFVALDLALHLATGTAWQGHTVTQQSVVYVVGEGFIGLAARIGAWCTAQGIRTTDLDPTFAIRPVPWNIADERARTAFSAEAEAHPITPALIVLDSLSANAWHGFDENQTANMKQLMDGARALVAQTRATVLQVHHAGHLDARSGAPARMRGSSDLFAALDVSLALRDENPHGLVLTFDKARDFAGTERFALALEVVGGSCVVRARADAPESSAGPGMTNDSVRLLKCIADGHTKPKAIIAALGTTGRAFYPRARALKAAGHCASHGNGKAAVYTLTSAGRALLDGSLSCTSPVQGNSPRTVREQFAALERTVPTVPPPIGGGQLQSSTQPESQEIDVIRSDQLVPGARDVECHPADVISADGSARRKRGKRGGRRERARAMKRQEYAVRAPGAAA